MPDNDDATPSPEPEQKQGAATPDDGAQPPEADVTTQDAQPSGEPGDDPKAEIEKLRAELEKTKETATRQAASQSALQQRLNQAEAREREREQQLLAQQTEAEQAELRRLRDSEDPEERDKYVAKMREIETEQKARSEGYSQAYGTATQTARAQLTNEVLSHPAFQGLSVEEKIALRDEAIAEAQTNGGWNVNYEADVLAKVAARLSGDASTQVTTLKDELKAKDEEIEALQAQLKDAGIAIAGSPSKGAGTPSSGSRDRNELLEDPDTPIDQIIEIRNKERASI